ncbi:hypothetical protein [Streptomyces fuscichromogenes]|uniref:ASCH domain-containing protein n=1 Tax=Streptomyces fuscichromogenes TaxID=1324013 RepID=A0A917XQS5_9ACTN|nr:hypothetical protein [Streptomyces fuscichromogenes]GGN46301.1 hypothetical protein GCM10011578_099090 [Streptomyces fuscichromogenes]
MAPMICEPYSVRALTLWQPYASAVAALGKDIENRGWSPGNYRGLILVHAGKATDRAALRYVPQDLTLPRSAVVAIARIAGAHTDCAGECSPWADQDSTWHLELSGAVQLPTPVTQVTGRQRIWVPDDALRQRVAAALPPGAACLAAHLRKEPGACTGGAVAYGADSTTPAPAKENAACPCAPTR